MRLAVSFLCCGVLLLCTLDKTAHANVVMAGTRVIYPAAIPEKTLQFSNRDAHPWLVQVWLDAGDMESEPDDMDDAVPFMVSPPIFRIEPDSRQAVRLMLTDDENLPTDRESVFWLNFIQIPALDAANVETSALMLLMRNRVKVFYRPRGLFPARPNVEKVACGLRFSVDGDEALVENPAAFHAVVRSAELMLDERRVSLLRSKVAV